MQYVSPTYVLSIGYWGVELYSHAAADASTRNIKSYLPYYSATIVCASFKYALSLT
jgi:hypothetical protein